MIEPLGQHSDWDDVEALVRGACGYVCPSEELRPRVLETARTESRERWVQRWVWQVSLIMALWGAVWVAIGNRWDSAAPFSSSVLQVQADVRPAEGGAAGWSVVESFTDLRRRQAALLSLTR